MPKNDETDQTSSDKTLSKRESHRSLKDEEREASQISLMGTGNAHGKVETLKKAIKLKTKSPMNSVQKSDSEE
jgi:hypothetical protein